MYPEAFSFQQSASTADREHSSLLHFVVFVEEVAIRRSLLHVPRSIQFSAISEHSGSRAQLAPTFRRFCRRSRDSEIAPTCTQKHSVFSNQRAQRIASTARSYISSFLSKKSRFGDRSYRRLNVSDLIANITT